MKANHLETTEATNKWWAARDARMRNIANQSSYTQKEQLAAERMKLALGLVYSAKDIHINYRKKFIAVKVDNPTIKDRKNLRLLEKDYTAAGVIKKESAQGFIYQINKA